MGIFTGRLFSSLCCLSLACDSKYSIRVWCCRFEVLNILEGGFLFLYGNNIQFLIFLFFFLLAYVSSLYILYRSAGLHLHHYYFETHNRRWLVHISPRQLIYAMQHSLQEPFNEDMWCKIHNICIVMLSSVALISTTYVLGSCSCSCFML